MVFLTSLVILTKLIIIGSENSSACHKVVIFIKFCVACKPFIKLTKRAWKRKCNLSITIS